MSVNRFDATLTDEQRDRANAAALLADQYAKLHQFATGAMEDSLDDFGRRFARKSHKAAPPSLRETPMAGTADPSLAPLRGLGDCRKRRPHEHSDRLPWDRRVALGVCRPSDASTEYNKVSQKSPYPSTCRRPISPERRPLTPSVIVVRDGTIHPEYGTMDARHGSVHAGDGTTDARHGSIHPEHGAMDF